MKQSKFIVGMFLSLLWAGCSDDMGVTQKLPISGDEIVFGAHAENLSIPQTRTIYGLPDGEEGNFSSYSALTISWEFGKDQVRVYSPQASRECQYADYTVMQGAGTAESPEAYLQKNGDIGVRWGDISQNHTFYAFYPLNKITSGLQGEATVTANIPVAQERGALLTSDTNPDVITDPSWKIIAPDMSYCMMAGTGTWQTTDPDKNVALEFTPLVNVLDVVVNGPADGEASRNIVSISVRSKTQDIVGNFTYDYLTQRFTFAQTSTGDNRIATVSCVQGEGTSSTPTQLAAGEKLNVKFFLLPRDIDADELSISVLMEGGYVLTQSLSGNGTASGGGSGNGILASGKITRVITPKLSMPDTNNWMSLIGDNVLFSQLSLPGSKQSYTGSMTVDNYNPTTDITQKYQDLYVATDGHGTTQFDAGIRAFDVDLEVQNDGSSFNPEYNAYVYSGTGQVSNPNGNGSMTISDVLNALNAKIRPNTASEYTEGVVVFFNFVNNNVSSSRWATTVMSEINAWSRHNSGVLQQLTPSTTMQDMRGKIAVIMNLVNAEDPTPSSPINYIAKYGTGRQNLTIQSRSYNGSTNVYIQNLMQVNNPTITSDPGTYGWRSGAGLVPYYITEAVGLGTTSSVDLIETKASLMSQLIEKIKTDGGTSMFINDLSGFCVVQNNNSTGWSGYRVREREYGLFGGRWSDPDATMLYDYQDLPSQSNYDYFGANEPSDANYGDTWLQFPYGADTEKGNGGNTGAFAERFNARATQAIADLVETGRTPMGIVLMNFAGSATVNLGSNIYQVQGIRLPGLVMSNNFLFELKTADGN